MQAKIKTQLYYHEILKIYVYIYCICFSAPGEVFASSNTGVPGRLARGRITGKCSLFKPALCHSSEKSSLKLPVHVYGSGVAEM